MNPIEKKQRVIITNGFKLLKEKKNYKQTTVVHKILALGFKTSKSTLSIILNGKNIGSDALKNTSKGLRVLIEEECCMKFNEKKMEFQLIPDCEPIKVVTQEKSNTNKNNGFVLHSTGRLPLSEKLEFLQNAQKEIIEIGVTLNTFTQHYFSRNESEFKFPIEKLLKKGVSFKCYLLDPECPECRIYLADRATILEEEQNDSEKIKLSIRKLDKIQKEFNSKNYAGNFEVYTYRHIPSSYYLVIDPSEKSISKMMTASYLFGTRRANCPILEFSRKDQPSLFLRHLNSFEKIMLNAKRIK